MTKRYGFPLRGMMSEPYYGRGSRKVAGLKDVPSKSRPRKLPKGAPADLLDGPIPFAAGKAACGPFPADTTRLRFNRHVLADHAKGERRVADTHKRHALVYPDGKVMASMVTDGNGADTAMFEKLRAKISDRASPGRFRPVSVRDAEGTRPSQTFKRPFAGSRGPLGSRLRVVLVIT